MPWMTGSSPRMRGAGDGVQQLGGVVGIIPAYAGSRLGRPIGMALRRDHPRVCGEQRSSAETSWSVVGSSPRMRGAATAAPPAAAAARIIPAYAGSRRSPAPSARPSRDHPRVCGEQELTCGGKWDAAGSSPRMRGAGRHRQDLPLLLGIIPAYAGSSVPQTGAAASVSDHPRRCGEQIERWGRISWMSGSSPQVRGAVVEANREASRLGIIPAGAGSRPASRARTWASRDHPRRCGEQPTRWRTGATPSGSSPQVRGAGVRRRGGPVADGIIPAGAGSRRWASSCATSPRDHPRRCGEQGSVESGASSNPGSSPHLRGAGHHLHCQS